MNGQNVEFFVEEGKNSPYYVESIAKYEERGLKFERRTGTVVSDPAMNDAGDWFVVVDVGGIFRSLDVYCLRSATHIRTSSAAIPMLPAKITLPYRLAGGDELRFEHAGNLIVIPGSGQKEVYLS